MRVGLVVDSACDLPHSFIKENDIYILPITARFDGHTVVDDHDPEKTRSFFESGLLDKGHLAETEAYSADQIRRLFLDEIVTEYDFAFLETVTRSRSLIYQNAWEAMTGVMAEYRQRRKMAGREGPFSMRVVDSGTLFAGQGLLAAHTIHLIKQGIPKNELRQRVESFVNDIHLCVLPRDIYYIRQRARRRGDNSVSGVVAFLGKALNITPLIWGRGHIGGPVMKSRNFEAVVERTFDYACRRIKAGLLSPYVCVSCGFPEEQIEALPGLDKLRDTCERHGVELLITQMGITSSVYLGPGGLMLALAAPPHEFDD